MAVNGPDPVTNPELVLLLDGRPIRQEASDDHPEQKSRHDHDGLHPVLPVCSEGGVLGRLLVVSRQDAQAELQQLHRGTRVSSEALGSYKSRNMRFRYQRPGGLRLT